jgi:hypothetical protein
LVFELVYSSFLSPTSDIRNVADIVRRARNYNRDHGLTSLLIFDGERFCQHIEGDRDAVLLLAGKIAADRRHQQFAILHQDFAGQARRFNDWHLAYALDSRGDVMDSLCRARGPEVVAYLQQQISALVFLP